MQVKPPRIGALVEELDHKLTGGTVERGAGTNASAWVTARGGWDGKWKGGGRCGLDTQGRWCFWRLAELKRREVVGWARENCSDSAREVR